MSEVEFTICSSYIADSEVNYSGEIVVSVGNETFYADLNKAADFDSIEIVSVDICASVEDIAGVLGESLENAQIKELRKRLKKIMWANK